jgi:leucyl/phenylalanyl-tRNA--protein transferase
LTPVLTDAYARMHEAGTACSFEVWEDEELIGGEFGVILGGVYFCESKFHTASGAGNYATGIAVTSLAASGFTVYDAQYGPRYLDRFSTHGLEPFGPDTFRRMLPEAASAHFQHILLRGGALAPPDQGQ